MANTECELCGDIRFAVSPGLVEWADPVDASHRFAEVARCVDHDACYLRAVARRAAAPEEERRPLVRQTT